MRRRRAGWLLLLGLVVLGACSAALIAADLVAQPRDRWAALLYVAGWATAVAWGRARRK
jgi:uncharacterized membrane protein YczE